MAGFLDKNTRIIDMVLTNHGKGLLSKGALHFCYWVPYDDNIDYQPYIAESGTLSTEQLSASIYLSIETIPLREATTGYKNFNSDGNDFTNVKNSLFTKSQSQKVLPRSLFPSDAVRTIETLQRKVQRVYISRDVNGKPTVRLDSVDIGVERLESTTLTMDFSYTKDSYPSDYQPDGFLFRVLRSGSNGLTEVSSRRDMSNDLSYGNDMRVYTYQRG